MAAPLAFDEWNANHKTMVLLGVKNEDALKKWESILLGLGLVFRTFVEPDMGDQKTAIAIVPLVDGKLFKKLQLYKG